MLSVRIRFFLFFLSRDNCLLVFIVCDFALNKDNFPGNEFLSPSVYQLAISQAAAYQSKSFRHILAIQVWLPTSLTHNQNGNNPTTPRPYPRKQLRLRLQIKLHQRGPRSRALSPTAPLARKLLLPLDSRRSTHSSPTQTTRTFPMRTHKTPYRQHDPRMHKQRASGDRRRADVLGWGSL